MSLQMARRDGIGRNADAPADVATLLDPALRKDMAGEQQNWSDDSNSHAKKNAPSPHRASNGILVTRRCNFPRLVLRDD